MKRKLIYSLIVGVLATASTETAAKATEEINKDSLKSIQTIEKGNNNENVSFAEKDLEPGKEIENKVLSFEKNEMSLNVGKEFKNELTILDEKYSLKDVVWSSSDEEVAKVF